jgi:hypothetical protein
MYKYRAIMPAILITEKANVIILPHPLQGHENTLNSRKNHVIRFLIQSQINYDNRQLNPAGWWINCIWLTG